VNPLFAYVAPIALLLPGAAAVNQVGDAGLPVATDASAESNLAQPRGEAVQPETLQEGIWQRITTGFLTMTGQQVRIEQVLTIRVSPRPPSAPPIQLADLPQPGAQSRLEERRMGRCVPMAGIAGMQFGGDRRLILFMRDRRIVSATLENTCHARDFYSGFYVAQNGDGMICQDRDQLQSRAGANCQIDGFRQLVESGN
jgi:hypothetical protein